MGYGRQGGEGGGAEFQATDPRLPPWEPSLCMPPLGTQGGPPPVRGAVKYHTNVDLLFANEQCVVLQLFTIQFFDHRSKDELLWLELNSNKQGVLFLDIVIRKKLLFASCHRYCATLVYSACK